MLLMKYKDYKYYVVIILVNGKTNVKINIINTNYCVIIINKVIYLKLEASLTILKKPFQTLNL